jgi:hypothetical protein
MNSAQWEAEAKAFAAHADKQRAKIARYGLRTRAPQYMLDTLDRFERRTQEALSNAAKAGEDEKAQSKP